MHQLQTKDGESVELNQLILSETYFGAMTDNYLLLNRSLFENPSRSFAPKSWEHSPFPIHYGENDPAKMLPPVVGAAKLVQPNYHRAGFNVLSVFWFQWNAFDDTMAALVSAASQLDWAARSKWQEVS